MYYIDRAKEVRIIFFTGCYLASRNVLRLHVELPASMSKKVKAEIRLVVISSPRWATSHVNKALQDNLGFLKT